MIVEAGDRRFQVKHGVKESRKGVGAHTFQDLTIPEVHSKPKACLYRPVDKALMLRAVRVALE